MTNASNFTSFVLPRRYTPGIIRPASFNFISEDWVSLSASLIKMAVSWQKLFYIVPAWSKWPLFDEILTSSNYELKSVLMRNLSILCSVHLCGRTICQSHVLEFFASTGRGSTNLWWVISLKNQLFYKCIHKIFIRGQRFFFMLRNFMFWGLSRWK